jgi:hypothetical protein
MNTFVSQLVPIIDVLLYKLLYSSGLKFNKINKFRLIPKLWYENNVGNFQLYKTNS